MYKLFAFDVLSLDDQGVVTSLEEMLEGMCVSTGLALLSFLCQRVSLPFLHASSGQHNDPVFRYGLHGSRPSLMNAMSEKIFPSLERKKKRAFGTQFAHLFLFLNQEGTSD